MRLSRLLLPALLLVLPLSACQVLYLPFQILNTALKGVRWAFQNAGGLIPLAGYLVLEEEEEGPSPAEGTPNPEKLLRRPPRGALALVLVPRESLGDPGLEAALRRRFPRARRLLPLRFPPGAKPLSGSGTGVGLPLLTAAPKGG